MRKLLFAAALLLLLPCAAEACTVPFIFIPGTVISSTQVNANFTAINACFAAGVFTSSISVGTNNAGTISANGIVLHEAQGSTLTIPSNLQNDADYLTQRSADLSMLTKATITGAAAAGNTPGIRFTLNAVNYDSRTAALTGAETNAQVALAICNAITGNTSLTTALAGTLDLLGQGMGSPLETGCAAQISGAVITFDQPYVGGLTASALSSGGITVTLTGAFEPTPKADGGPVHNMVRRYPSGYVPSANDLGPFINIQYATNSGTVQSNYMKTIFTGATSVDLQMGSLNGGSFKGGLGLGAGPYAFTNASLCYGDRGAGTISACGFHSRSETGSDNATIIDTTDAAKAAYLSLRRAGVEQFTLVATGTDQFTIRDVVHSANLIQYGLSSGDLTLGTGAQLTMVDAGAKISAVLPTSAGAGGVNVCIDNVGVLYKKASCP